MKPSVSAPVDRVHGLVKALRERAEASIEKAEDGPPGSWVWRKATAPQDSRCQFAEAYDAFVDGLDTMKAARNDLENQGYEDCDFVFLDAAGKEYFHAAGIQACYVSLVKARHTYLSGSPGGVAHLLDSIRPLEQALLKARKWLKTQKRSKRKCKDDAYVWFNSTEAGCYIGPSSKTITTWIRLGTLQFYGKNGTKYKFLKSELDTKKATYKPRKPRKTGD
jgi:hypothetical protein